MARNSIRRIPPGQPIPTETPRRYRTSDGYIVLRWKLGKRTYLEALEHRVVNGRVTDAQHIHHRNHRRTDNRSDNLQPVTSKQHRQAHSKYSPFYEEWAELYRQGWTTTQIGDKYGTNNGTVYRRLRDVGVTPRTVGEAKRLPLDVDRIVAMFESGMSPRSIGKHFGCSDSPIRNRLAERGIPPRPPGRPVSVSR